MSGTRCHEFERWLDDGDPGALPGAWLEHARGCARCAATLARARALDALLADALPVAAPGRLTAAVLSRLETPPARVPFAPPVPPDPMPLGVRIAMDPAVALSLTLAAVCVWQGPRLLALTRALVAGLGAVLPRAASTPHPWMLALTFAPLTVVTAVALYRFSERLGEAALPRPSGRR